MQIFSFPDRFVMLSIMGFLDYLELLEDPK